jgi:hypothetical protein
LQTVFAERTRVTAAGAEQLRAALPKVRVVR